RLSEAIPILRRLWSGEPVTHGGGHYPAFDSVAMQPPPRQPGGPPIWFGGRSELALRRTGRLGDGWLAYVVTAQMYAAALEKIAAAAAPREPELKNFRTRHLLFTRLHPTSP